MARKQRKIVTSQQPFLKTRQVSSIKTSSTKLLLSLKDNFARSKNQKTPQRIGLCSLSGGDNPGETVFPKHEVSEQISKTF